MNHFIELSGVPKYSEVEIFVLIKSLPVLLVLYPVPAEMKRYFYRGISLVFIWMIPPTKSAGMSGLAVLLTMILSIRLFGIRSNEKFFLSDSVLGSCEPFRKNYYNGLPFLLTTTNLSLRIVTPFILFND